MAKFFRCWVIVAGAQPTAFRSRERDDLLPTLRQLQRTQPDVDLRWFERGRLWRTPEEAAAALIERRRAPISRSREWRPGGEHKDPKARPQVPRDEKRALFKKRLIARKSRGDGFPPADGGRRPPSGSDRPKSSFDRAPRPPATSRGPSPAGPRPPRRSPGGPTSSSWRPPGPSSGRRPPSGPSRSDRPPSARRPAGRPPSGRPPGKPPRGRNGK